MCCLVEGYEDYFHTDRNLEKGGEFNRLFRCQHSFLLLHQNSTRGSFLKVSCNVESEDILMNILNCYIKIHWSILRLNRFFFVHNIVTLTTGHLKNIDLLSYVDLPNVDTSHFTRSKTNSTHSLILLPISSECLSIGKLSLLQWQMHVFQNSNFYLKNQILPLATNTIIYFPLSDNFPSSILRACLPNTQI